MRILTALPPAQNPVSVKVREEVVRLTKKIKTAEAELVLKRGQGERQVQTIAKLQEDLDKINSGKSLIACQSRLTEPEPLEGKCCCHSSVSYVATGFID